MGIATATWCQVSHQGAAVPSALQLSVPSAVQYENTEGSIKLDGYLQHAVIECRDLDDEVDFWTKGMGMRVLRTRTIGGKQTKFVGYGPETLKSSVGGHFALEITEAEGKFDIGTGFQRFNFEVPPKHYNLNLKNWGHLCVSAPWSDPLPEVQK